MHSAGLNKRGIMPRLVTTLGLCSRVALLAYRPRVSPADLLFHRSPVPSRSFPTLRCAHWPLPSLLLPQPPLLLRLLPPLLPRLSIVPGTAMIAALHTSPPAGVLVGVRDWVGVKPDLLLHRPHHGAAGQRLRIPSGCCWARPAEMQRGFGRSRAVLLPAATQAACSFSNASRLRSTMCLNGCRAASTPTTGWGPWEAGTATHPPTRH